MLFGKKTNYDQLFNKCLDIDFKVHKPGNRRVSSQDLNDFEKKYNVTIPKELKAYALSSFGDAYIELKEEFRSTIYGIAIYSFAENSPEWMNIHIQTEKFQSHTHTDFVPFLQIVPNSDLYCFNKSGIIHHWDHEIRGFHIIEKSFDEVLEYELAALKAKKDRQKATDNRKPSSS